MAGEDISVFGSEAMDQVHPMWLLRTLPNNVLAYTGIGHGFKGANENVTAHGISGAQAIAEACRYLRAWCDRPRCRGRLRLRLGVRRPLSTTPRWGC